LFYKKINLKINKGEKTMTNQIQTPALHKELNKHPETINSNYLVSELKVDKTKKGDEYAKYKLTDKTDSVVATHWNLTPDEKEMLQNNEVLLVSGNGGISNYSGEYEITVTGIQLSKDVDYDALTPSEPIDSHDTFKKLKLVVSKFENPILKRITLALLEDKKGFLMNGSAALGMHHSKRHGLLRHVVEMIQIAANIISVYPDILNKDLLYSGIIFHDVMKQSEYVYSEHTGIAKDFSSDGVLFGHVVMGSKLPEHYATEEERNSEELRMLQHLILAHHGKLEWGSPVQPATPEAYVLHMVDNIDAKLYVYQEELAKLEPGEHTKVKRLGHSIYKTTL
jgi:3'-5' exoribonuclease